MPDEKFASIVLEHVRRYPLMQVDDLYKLAHQASLGSEHAVEREDAARAWLKRELAEMGAGPTEPLLDAISGDGRILRCHLRPYVQAGYDPEVLLQAFVCTARRVTGSPQDLRDYLDIILYMAESRQIVCEVGEVCTLFTRLESSNWPAVHHSVEFTQAYRPAYRVIAREFLPAHILTPLRKSENMR